MSRATVSAIDPQLAGLPAGLSGADPRSRLLAAAVATVSERGYGTASLAGIAAEAEVSRSVFARHFDDKQACYLAAYDVVIEWLGEGIAEALAHDGGWPQGVGTAVQTTLGLLALDPRLARFCGTEPLFAGPAPLERHQATVRRLAAPLRAGRAHCAWGAELPRQLEETVVGGAIWSIATHARGDGFLELAPELTYFLLTPYFEVAEARRLAGVR
jgi:AcrR family transcriptional regulator